MNVPRKENLALPSKSLRFTRASNTREKRRKGRKKDAHFKPAVIKYLLQRHVLALLGRLHQGLVPLRLV